MKKSLTFAAAALTAALSVPAVLAQQPTEPTQEQLFELRRALIDRIENAYTQADADRLSWMSGRTDLKAPTDEEVAEALEILRSSDVSDMMSVRSKNIWKTILTGFGNCFKNAEDGGEQCNEDYRTCMDNRSTTLALIRMVTPEMTMADMTYGCELSRGICREMNRLTFEVCLFGSVLGGPW